MQPFKLDEAEHWNQGWYVNLRNQLHSQGRVEAVGNFVPKQQDAVEYGLDLLALRGFFWITLSVTIEQLSASDY